MDFKVICPPLGGMKEDCARASGITARGAVYEYCVIRQAREIGFAEAVQGKTIQVLDEANNPTFFTISVRSKPEFSFKEISQ